MADLGSFLDEIGELHHARLVTTLAEQVAALGPDVEVEVEPLMLRFHVREQTLCELSVYGELFIVRVGPAAAVEYRVRNEEVALRALDQVLREYVQLASPGSAAVP
jgi:hypothetical protein